MMSVLNLGVIHATAGWRHQSPPPFGCQRWQDRVPPTPTRRQITTPRESRPTQNIGSDTGPGGTGSVSPTHPWLAYGEGESHRVGPKPGATMGEGGDGGGRPLLTSYVASSSEEGRCAALGRRSVDA